MSNRMPSQLWLTGCVAVALLVVLAASSPRPNDSVGVNVMDYMLGDVKDAGPAIQAAIDDCNGGIVWFPPGKYTVLTPIEIRAADVQLIGGGGLSPRVRNTWIDWRGKGALFTFPANDQRKNGFRIEGLLLYGHDNRAFDLVAERPFQRIFTFRDVSFMRFATAIKIVPSEDSVKRVGDILIDRCRITDGGMAIDSTTAWITMLKIVDSTITGNSPPEGSYVIDLKRPAVLRIEDNSLEGQPRVLRCVDGRGLNLGGNQYEGHHDVVWWIENCKGVCVGAEDYYRLAGEPDDPPRFQFHASTYWGPPLPESMLVK